MDLPILTGSRLRLRPLAPADREALLAIRAEPGVSDWWGEVGDDEPLDTDEGVAAFVIEVQGVVAGALQYVEQLDLQYRSAGIDIYLGAAWEGRGLGREAIRLVVEYLVETRGHHRLTIDPASANHRAIRCYESVGFRRVGVMREYERADDGRWRDGLLMELLAADWRER